MYVNEHVVEVSQPRAMLSLPGDADPVLKVKTIMSMNLSEYRTWRNTQESLGNAFDLPVLGPFSSEIVTAAEKMKAEIKPAEPIPVVKSRTKYETAYWQFVNAKTSDEAEKAFETMMYHVTRNMEPAQDNSWVKDPETIVHHEPKKKIHPEPVFLAMLWWSCMIFFVLHLTGVLI